VAENLQKVCVVGVFAFAYKEIAKCSVGLAVLTTPSVSRYSNLYLTPGAITLGPLLGQYKRLIPVAQLLD
jgi:hypothetical protein